jgi:hypothetical protein
MFVTFLYSTSLELFVFVNPDDVRQYRGTICQIEGGYLNKNRVFVSRLNIIINMLLFIQDIQWGGSFHLYNVRRDNADFHLVGGLWHRCR